jgi:hypothetical protein
MGVNAALALQRAMVAHLRADASLALMLGGPHVYDEPPANQKPPYVTVAGIETRDWSAMDGRGAEHMVTLHVWSLKRGRKEAQTIVGAIDDRLDNAPLYPDGHRLVNLRTLFWTALPEPDGERTRGLMRLRAVTEPL